MGHCRHQSRRDTITPAEMGVAYLGTSLVCWSVLVILWTVDDVGTGHVAIMERLDAPRTHHTQTVSAVFNKPDGKCQKKKEDNKR